MRKPFELTNLVTPALGGIVLALTERGGQSEAARRDKADAVMSLILAFQPRDAIDMTLAGQTVLYNELLADGARDVFRGMADTTKQRSLTILANMGRLMQGHVDRLERRGGQPYRTEAATSEAEAGAASADRPAPAERKQQPRTVAAASPAAAETAPLPMMAAAIPIVTAVAEPEDAGGGMPAGEPEAESSWLDEPFEQWLIETPADLAVCAAEVRAGELPVDMTAIEQNDDADAVGIDPEMYAETAAEADELAPLLPRRDLGYAPVRAPPDAVAAD